MMYQQELRMEYEHKGELEHQTVKIDSLELRYDHKGICELRRAKAPAFP